MNNMRKKCTGEYILSKKEMKQLIKTCEQTDKPVEDKYIVLMPGRLALRIAETAHMKRRWIDFKRGVISIPWHGPCACGYCRAIVKKRTGCKKISTEEVIKHQWRPMSKASVRSIPFGFDQEVEEVLKAFFRKYEECPFSVTTIRKRIRYLGDLAGLKNLHPHQLRATAIARFAADGINTLILTKIAGWRDLGTCEKFLNVPEAMVKDALEKIYGSNKRGI